MMMMMTKRLEYACFAFGRKQSLVWLVALSGQRQRRQVERGTLQKVDTKGRHKR